MSLCTFQAQYHCVLREREREREKDIKQELTIMGCSANDQTKAKDPNWIVASTPTLTSLLPSIPKSRLASFNNYQGHPPQLYYHGIPIHKLSGADSPLST